MSDIFALLPAPTEASKPFWEGCNRGELLLQHCLDCLKSFYYPRIFCPHCGARRNQWLRSKGEGVVFSFSEVHVSFYGAAWESQLPYTLLLVDLDDGPRMLSRLVSDGESTDDVKVGERVGVHFVEVNGQKLPYFRKIT